MNEELIQEIESKTDDSTVETAQVSMTTWLIFLISDKKYAVRSCDVVEIISDLSVYKLPFMPKYVEGVLNRRGDPFTVINPNVILQEDPNLPPPEKSLFMIFNRRDDQLSLHISDILLFTSIEDTNLKLILDSSDESFFLGTVTYDGEDIPILNPNAFELKLRKDCGNI